MGLSTITDVFTSNPDILCWSIAFIVFLIIEGLTFNALVMIWFAIASLFSLLAAVAGLGFIPQLAIFAVSSVILLIVTRPLVRKLKTSQRDPNAEYDIGSEAVVIKKVMSGSNAGRVRMDGVEWQARSADDTEIDEGETVYVRRIEGTKLIVSK